LSEALANAARHAQATRVEIQVEEDGHNLLVSVGDDGVGGADPTRGSGLVGLRDRVEALGGEFAIASRAGGGTSLRATIPTVTPIALAQ
jgi:signal transduction histidine kinase